MQKNPTYQEDSEEFRKQIELRRESTFAEVKKLLSDSSKEAAKTLIAMVSQGSDDKIRMDAAKHILKLCGLEIEKSEVEHKNVKISIEHAQKIQELANVTVD